MKRCAQKPLPVVRWLLAVVARVHGLKIVHVCLRLHRFRQGMYMLRRERDGTPDCLDCSEMDGVDCTDKGRSAALLPIKPGFWRSGRESATVLVCWMPDACSNENEATTCAPNHRGPRCDVCTEDTAKMRAASGLTRFLGRLRPSSSHRW